MTPQQGPRDKGRVRRVCLGMGKGVRRVLGTLVIGWLVLMEKSLFTGLEKEQIVICAYRKGLAAEAQKKTFI